MATPASERATAILVAAGSSTRMGGGPRKPLLEIGGRTLVEHAAGAFDAVGEVEAIVIVGHPDDLARLRELARSSPALAKVRAVVAGGEQRVDSVRAGVAAASAGAVLLCVHDAARPLVEPETIRRAIVLATREGAAIVAVAVRDTLKRSDARMRAESTLDRTGLWAAQTPQIFRAALLCELLERAHRDGFVPTDCAALHERYAGPVPIVEGEPTNIKVTTPADLALAAAILAQREGARP